MPQTIKPATPLPWVASEGRTGFLGQKNEDMSPAAGITAVEPKMYGGTRVFELHALTKFDDAAYAAHAANAYPRLVEALRHYVENTDPLHPSCRVGAGMHLKAGALLRELGGE